MMDETLTAGQALAALRREKTGACADCGRAFTTLANRRWCSESCKQRAKYQRRKLAKRS